MQPHPKAIVFLCFLQLSCIVPGTLLTRYSLRLMEKRSAEWNFQPRDPPWAAKVVHRFGLYLLAFPVVWAWLAARPQARATEDRPTTTLGSLQAGIILTAILLLACGCGAMQALFYLFEPQFQ